MGPASDERRYYVEHIMRRAWGGIRLRNARPKANDDDVEAIVLHEPLFLRDGPRDRADAARVVRGPGNVAADHRTDQRERQHHKYPDAEDDHHGA